MFVNNNNKKNIYKDLLLKCASKPPRKLFPRGSLLSLVAQKFGISMQPQNHYVPALHLQHIHVPSLHSGHLSGLSQAQEPRQAASTGQSGSTDAQLWAKYEQQGCLCFHTQTHQGPRFFKHPLQKWRRSSSSVQGVTWTFQQLAKLPFPLSQLYSSLESITELEGWQTLASSLQIVEKVRTSLTLEPFIGKLEETLRKNPGLSMLSDIAAVLSDKYVEGLNVDTNTISNFKCAPATSVDCEQAFSHFKDIYSNKRRCLTEEHLMMLIQWNNGFFA